MTKRNPVSAISNIWFDAEQVDDSDLTLEQNYNNAIQSGIINNHIGTGILSESLTQNVIFDSSLVTGFLDGIGITSTNIDYHINQPTDNDLGNQLEIELTDSKVCGKKTIKVAIFGLDFESNLQYETFIFKTNEIQISHKHFTSVLVLLFNDFIGDASLSFNLGGRIIIRETNPLTLSRSPIMLSQDIQPNLFFRDFFFNGTESINTVLQTALPYYNIDTLNIYTSNKDQKVLLNGDVVTQIGQKFIATTNNIQKITLLLSVRNIELGSTDLAWTGDLILSIYPLQTTIECPTDVVPNLSIDFAPTNIPIAQTSINYDSLKSMGVVLDDGNGNSVPQPVDFIFSNSPISTGNYLTVGNYYAFALKRSGSANKCDILIDIGSDLVSNSRVTTFTGTLWVDEPDEDLWFRIYTDAAKISDGQAYDSGNGIVLSKTNINSESLTTQDYSYKDIEFTGNDIYRACVSAIIEESTPIPNQRTGQPVNSRQQFVPEIKLLNSIDIANLETAEPLLIGAISDKNQKSFNPSSATFISNLHSATFVKDELLIKIIDSSDSSRYDPSVEELENKLSNGDFNNAKIIPNASKSNIYYRVASAKLCSNILGDVNGDGIIDETDLSLLNSYIGYNLNSSLPNESVIDTDGITTTFTNGYLASISAFNDAFGVSFQLVDPSTNLVVAAGTDGVLTANPSNERLAQFTSVSVSFSPIVGLTDYKLVILPTVSSTNLGGFEIYGSDSLLDTITIRKVILTGDSIAEMLRADVNRDFAITEADQFLLENYINRVPEVTEPSPTYPAPTTSYDAIGTRFKLIRLKLEKFEDRADDYSPVSTGRSTEIHPEQDIFISDTSLQDHNFLLSAVPINVIKQLFWDESLIVTNSKVKLVPSVFTSTSGLVTRSCSLETVLCSKFPTPINFDPGTIDMFVPNNLIIGNGNITKPDGSFHKVDFEVGTIVLEIPNGLYNSEKRLNILEDFIAENEDTPGLTKCGFPAMKFADCSYVTMQSLSNDQVRFSVAVQSFSPNTNGTIDGYEGVIVDGKIGVSVDYETGIIRLNFTNLYEDNVLSTLSTKIQINVYLKKGGFNNDTLFVDSTKVQNILDLMAVFNGPAVEGPVQLIDLETEVTGILPIAHGGTGLNDTGTYGTVLTSSGGSLSYQFIYDLPGSISHSLGESSANRIPKTDGYGLLDPSFYYKNPVYIYGSAGSFSHDSESPMVIGAFPFRFDKYIGQSLESINLEVILETTNVLNTAEIQLYNLNTHTYLNLDGVLTKLTTTSTEATFLVSDNIAEQLSEGGSNFLYEIHLSLNAGSVTESAICKMARLVINYENPYAAISDFGDALSCNFVPFMPPLPPII